MFAFGNCSKCLISGVSDVQRVVDGQSEVKATTRMSGSGRILWHSVFRQCILSGVVALVGGDDWCGHQVEVTTLNVWTASGAVRFT
jgi:hypothetical protein